MVPHVAVDADECDPFYTGLTMTTDVGWSTRDHIAAAAGVLPDDAVINKTMMVPQLPLLCLFSVVGISIAGRGMPRSTDPSPAWRSIRQHDGRHGDE